MRFLGAQPPHGRLFLPLVVLGSIALVGLLGPWAHGTLVSESASGMSEPTETEATAWGLERGGLLLLVPLLGAVLSLLVPLPSRLQHALCGGLFAVTFAGVITVLIHDGLGLFWWHRAGIFETWQDARPAWGILLALVATGTATAAASFEATRPRESRKSAPE